MTKGASISGFPEWLPSERAVEQALIDTVRHTFELHGFIGIETCAVETGASLLKKGETSKEIYLLSRLQDVSSDAHVPVEERLGLHFDLTVPLSRYVLEHSGQLAFPFKRWQIQKVWRGERPQGGRFREFYQADIDVIGDGVLPEHYEVELPLVMCEALQKLQKFGLPTALIHVNNRKLSEGFYRGIGLTDIESTLREIDKLDKIGADEVKQLLCDNCGATSEQADACLELATISTNDPQELTDAFNQLCEKHHIDRLSENYHLAEQGLQTICTIIREAERIQPHSVIADCKIARGLDYYTGSVYETFIEGAPELGSICSGGRYDSLVNKGNKKYPGVGLSIGLSRLLSYLLKTLHATANRQSPAAVMVAVWNENDRHLSNAIASTLRSRGICADVAPQANKIGKQIKYADKLGIPYLWFPATTESEQQSVKNIITGEQVEADPLSWVPDTLYKNQGIIINNTKSEE